MKKQILIIVAILAVFVGGLLLGRYMERKSQEAICVARIAETKQQEHSACGVMLDKAVDREVKATDAYVKLVKQYLGH